MRLGWPTSTGAAAEVNPLGIGTWPAGGMNGI